MLNSKILKEIKKDRILFLIFSFIAFIYISYIFNILPIVFAEQGFYIKWGYSSNLIKAIKDIPNPGYLQLINIVQPFFLKWLFIPIKYAHFILNFLTVLTISVCIASVFLFKNLFRSNILKYFVFFCILFHPDYEIKTYINVGYYLAVPIILFLFDFNNILNYKKSLVLMLSIIFALGIATKPSVLIIIAGFGVYGLYFVIKKDWKKVQITSLFLILPFLAILSQIAYSITHPTDFGYATKIAEVNDKILSINALISLIYQFFLFIVNAIGFTKIGFHSFYPILSVGVLFFAILFYLIKNKDKKNYIRILSLIATLALGVILMYQSKIGRMNIETIFPTHFYNGRQMFVQSLTAFFILIVAIDLCYKENQKKLWLIFTTVMLVLANVFNLSNLKLKPIKSWLVQDNWYALAKNANGKADFCAPIQPPVGWFSDCNVIYSADKLINENLKEIRPIYDVEKFIKNNKVALVGIALKHNFKKFKKIQEHDIKLELYNKNNELIGFGYLITPNKYNDFIYFNIKENSASNQLEIIKYIKINTQKNIQVHEFEGDPLWIFMNNI